MMYLPSMKFVKSSFKAFLDHPLLDLGFVLLGNQTLSECFAYCLGLVLDKNPKGINGADFCREVKDDAGREVEEEL